MTREGLRNDKGGPHIQNKVLERIKLPLILIIPNRWLGWRRPKRVAVVDPAWEAAQD
jgi:hypothetical protein